MDGASEDVLLRLVQEAIILGQFQHPNVLSVVGFVSKSTETSRPLVVEEYLRHGALDRYLRQSKPPVEARLKMVEQVARGFQYLSSCNFVIGVSYKHISSISILHIPFRRFQPDLFLWERVTSVN